MFTLFNRKKFNKIKMYLKINRVQKHIQMKENINKLTLWNFAKKSLLCLSLH